MKLKNYIMDLEENGHYLQLAELRQSKLTKLSQLKFSAEEVHACDFCGEVKEGEWMNQNDEQFWVCQECK